VDWPRFVAQFPANREPPLLAEILRRNPPTDEPRTNGSLPLRERLKTTTPGRQVQLLQDEVSAWVTRLLRLPPDVPPDLRRPLPELGFDSLMAVELRNVLAAETGLPLSATLLFDFPTIEGIAARLVKELVLVEATVQSYERLAPALEEIEHCSEAELDELIINLARPHLDSSDGQRGLS